MLPISALKSPKTTRVLVACAMCRTSLTWVRKVCLSPADTSDVGAYTPTRYSPRLQPCLGSCRPHTLSPEAYVRLPPDRHHSVQTSSRRKPMRPRTMRVQIRPATLNSRVSVSPLTSVKTRPPQFCLIMRWIKHLILSSGAYAPCLAPSPLVFHVANFRPCFHALCLCCICACFRLTCAKI